MQQMYPPNNQQGAAQKGFSSEYSGYFPEEKIRVAPSGIVLYLATILLTNALFYFTAAQLQARKTATKVGLIGAFLVSLAMLYVARFSFVSLGDLVAYMASVLIIALILAAIFFVAVPRLITRSGHKRSNTI
jgi:ABC-type multidrug transport system permease subunit